MTARLFEIKKNLKYTNPLPLFFLDLMNQAKFEIFLILVIIPLVHCRKYERGYFSIFNAQLEKKNRKRLAICLSIRHFLRMVFIKVLRNLTLFASTTVTLFAIAY